MLFNSHVFIFLFLPVAVYVYYSLGRKYNHRLAVSWLVAASLFYYAWWNPAYVSLIIISMLFNYSVGISLSSNKGNKKTLLAFGVLCNLALLAYYKYTNFFVDTLNDLTGSSYQISDILLPLAISFFTFQQIAYLVDSYQKKTREYDFLNYSLFVTFFPQLIAGPIVHHREMLSQFAKDETFVFKQSNLEIGIAIFCMGLFKKVVIADNIARYSTPLFTAAFEGNVFSMVDAWIGAFAYTFQLYFDFSGYSDMAIGIGLMFGIRLPINFLSPYKATSIIEFWSRWHITLSRFLRDYLYIPLGGNRLGNLKRYRNLMITMLLGGLWHGAGWTFIIWGGLHGLYLLVNHAWRIMSVSIGRDISSASRTYLFASRVITFFVVLLAWVFFRAENFDSAMLILSTMFGLADTNLIVAYLFEGVAIRAAAISLLLLIIVWCLPSTTEWAGYTIDSKNELSDEKGCMGKYLSFKANKVWAVIVSILFIVAVLNLTRVSEFIYFNF